MVRIKATQAGIFWLVVSSHLVLFKQTKLSPKSEPKSGPTEKRLSSFSVLIVCSFKRGLSSLSGQCQLWWGLSSLPVHTTYDIYWHSFGFTLTWHCSAVLKPLAFRWTSNWRKENLLLFDVLYIPHLETCSVVHGPNYSSSCVLASITDRRGFVYVYQASQCNSMWSRGLNTTAKSKVNRTVDLKQTLQGGLSSVCFRGVWVLLKCSHVHKKCWVTTLSLFRGLKRTKYENTRKTPAS